MLRLTFYEFWPEARSRGVAAIGNVLSGPAPKLWDEYVKTDGVIVSDAWPFAK
jgi:hypothetical protein